MKKLKELIYCYGFYVGIALIVIPIAYDVLWIGARSALIWSIGVKGMVIQIAGLWLMISGGRNAK